MWLKTFFSTENRLKHGCHHRWMAAGMGGKVEAMCAQSKEATEQLKEKRRMRGGKMKMI